MQRGLVVLAVTCLCLVNGYSQIHQKTVDVVKQKAIFELYWHPDQPTVVSPELYQKSRSWSFEEHDGDYTDKAIVYDFIQLWKYGLLHKDAVFSVFHQEHLEEVIALFKLFYFAKDFETFYNTAVWARFNVNEKLFLYVFSVAIMHRPDTKNVVLPPFHEVFPHMFFNNEVIQAAYRAKMGDIVTKKSVGVKYQDGGDVIIHSNYSGWYLINNDHAEEKLSYFTEDVGLGFYYFTFSHDYPFWLSSEKYGFQKEIRGELYYYGHKQLLARYYLERLSNDLGEIESIDWHRPIVSGYYPTIFHSNGLPYPSRPSYSDIPENKYELIHDIEELATYIHYLIDSGVTDEINFLGNFIEGNADFINSTFYGSFDHIARNILGYGLDPIDKNHIFPSALEYYSTSVRDPAFYRIHKKIFTYFLKYKKHLPKYTYNDIVFPGVKIESVAVDKLLTFFEKFDSVISNGVPVNSLQDAISSTIKVRQHRLNHKPFTYHITVNSDKDVKSIIRIFLGPKYDTYGHEIDFVKNWVNFVELDQWVVDLKTGTNKIERNSHESKYVAQDIPSIEVTWNKLKAAIEKGETYTYNDPVYGFPDRLVLPKGKKEGLPLKIFVYISHFDKEHSFHTESPVWGVDDVDIKPMGYPLDRPVFPYAFNVPNAFFKDVVVFHKNVDELNLTV